ncbi:MAG: hypothetical protein Q7S89_03405 [bacterium]|nr:hypothetical protein [bacterium]
MRDMVPYAPAGLVQREMMGGDGELTGLANSPLAQVSPRTIERLRGALWRGQSLAALSAPAAEFASGVADAVRVRVSQSRTRVSAGFRLGTSNRGRYAVVIEGEIWVDGT